MTYENYIPGVKFDIKTTCEKCFYNPNSHSFHLLSINKTLSEAYFYSCIGKSKYYNDDDDEGFVKHMQIEISKIKTKTWVWVFDGAQFGFKHLASPSFGMKIVNFLDSFNSKNLQKIIIINQNNIPFKIMLNTIWHCIPQYIRKKIVFDKNKLFSKLLNIDDKLYLLEEKLTF